VILGLSEEGLKIGKKRKKKGKNAILLGILFASGYLTGKDFSSLDE